MKLRPWPFWGLLAVGSLVVSYGAYSYWGPYRWLAQLSLSAFGAYSPKFTFVFAVLLLVLPPALLLARFDAPRSAAAAAERRRIDQAVDARFRRSQGWLILAALGAVLLFIGVRDLRIARAGLTLTHTSCANIEAGKPPDGTWLDIEGTALRDAAIQTKENHVSYTYVPLVSDTWSKRKPLPVLLLVETHRPVSLDAHSFQGGISSEDVPGMVRTAYEGRGVQADHALVLKIGKIPRDSLTRSQLAFVGGLLAVLVGLVMARRKWSEA